MGTVTVTFPGAVRLNYRKLLPGLALVSLWACSSTGADPRTLERAKDLYRQGQELEQDESTFLVAIGKYSEAIKVWPGFAQAHDRRGRLYAEKGKLKEAEADFNRANELAPDEPIYANNRAKFFKELGRLAEAERDYNRALAEPDRLGENAPRVLMNRAALYWDTKRYDEAIKDFEAVLRYRSDRDTKLMVQRYIQKIRDEQKLEGMKK